MPDAEHDAVPIWVHNATSEGIWLRPLLPYPGFPLQISEGVDLVTAWDPCDLACADFTNNDCSNLSGPAVDLVIEP